MTREELIVKWPVCDHKCKGKYTCGCTECGGMSMFSNEKYKLDIKKILTYLVNGSFFRPKGMSVANLVKTYRLSGV